MFGVRATERSAVAAFGRIRALSVRWVPKAATALRFVAAVQNAKSPGAFKPGELKDNAQSRASRSERPVSLTLLCFENRARLGNSKNQPLPSSLVVNVMPGPARRKY